MFLKIETLETFHDRRPITLDPKPPITTLEQIKVHFTLCQNTMFLEIEKTFPCHKTKHFSRYTI